ncbi:MAG: hypothetical protein M3A24_05195 [Candidatus Rhabdochlamydia oedothoracis]|nr:hypothetical protein [Candidatus Rhabdochlamydia oedothoracis]
MTRSYPSSRKQFSKIHLILESTRKKTRPRPEYDGSRFYCSTFEKILNRL